MNGRYGTFERRILELFATDLSKTTIEIPTGHELDIWYLLKDGFLRPIYDRSRPVSISFGTGGVQSSGRLYALTDKGREFVGRWVRAEELP